MAVPAWAGPSVYRTAPDDPKAVTVKATGDGVADDTAAIQQALDAVSNRGAGGLVFLPSGRYRLTRGILEALAAARTPASVVTKGPMVIRDRDVLAALRDRAGVSVCVSVTTLDRDRWLRLEPGTAPPRQRLRAVAALAAAGISVGVLLAPIVPGLTTDRENLEAVVKGAAESGAAFLGAGVLHLEPGVREHFDGFLAARSPSGEWFRDDDGGGETDARLELPPMAGTWLVIVTSFGEGETGRYRLVVTR